MTEQIHQPVLLAEVIAGLAPQHGGIYVDGTFGRGGHSAAILKQIGATGRLIAIDKDPQAVASGLAQFGHDPRFTITQGSFTQLQAIVQAQGLLGQVQGILLDLGVSSPQLDDPSRGFSFLKDGPLDMRMDPLSGISVASWLQQAKEAEIANVLYEYGEERFSRRIARAIVVARQQTPIITTGQLAEIVKAANPKWEVGKHPATRSFQALRIFINSELADLQACLQQTLDVLAVGGRLAVISFHSLEDRIVKRFMREQAQGPTTLHRLPIQAAQLQVRMRTIGRASFPSAEEVEQNPRARSSVLRIAEKIL